MSFVRSFFTTNLLFDEYVEEREYLLLGAMQGVTSLIPFRSHLEYLFSISLLVSNVFLFTPDFWILEDATKELLKIIVDIGEAMVWVVVFPLVTILEDVHLKLVMGMEHSHTPDNLV